MRSELGFSIGGCEFVDMYGPFFTRGLSVLQFYIFQIFFSRIFSSSRFSSFFSVVKKKIGTVRKRSRHFALCYIPKVCGAKFCVFPVFLGKKKEENLEKGCSIRTALKGRGLRNAVVVASCCCSRL